MSGGQRSQFTITDTVPFVTDREVMGALSAIAKRPKEEWTELVAMLGLDGAPVHSSRQKDSKGRFV